MDNRKMTDISIEVHALTCESDVPICTFTPTCFPPSMFISEKERKKEKIVSFDVKNSVYSMV
jgi:hypothetical protein